MNVPGTMQRWARPVLAAAVALVMVTGAASLGGTDNTNCAEVVARMVTRDRQRHAALHAYSTTQKYHVVYDGLGHEVADMQVRMDYVEPGPKKLTVISESGSGLLRRHVLDPLIATERREAAIEFKQGPAITPKNYDFDLVATPSTDPLGDYVLKAHPHKGDRFLFRGKIWVNPENFGIVKVKGEPTDDHSWWVNDTRFAFSNQQVGDFWLPQANHITCHVRFFGHAVLDITYGDFSITSASPVPPMEAEAAIPVRQAQPGPCPACSD